MANCRIQNLTPTCGYNGDGVITVLLLDFEDLIGFTFKGNASYASCYVEKIIYNGSFVSIDLPDYPAQYTGALNGGIYNHSLEAFIAELSAPILADLHLATKRPQLVVFKTRTGRYFTYGYEKGAKASYAAQTADNTGAVLTLTDTTVYPLFEVSPLAFIKDGQPFTYVVNWGVNSVCEINGLDDKMTGYQQAGLALKVSPITGLALDINNKPIAVSGKLQAALKLINTTSPTGYDIEGTFNARSLVNGEPTVRYAPSVCAEGVIAAWVLDTGFWRMSALWLDDGVWKF